jgi:hypothetical protein
MTRLVALLVIIVSTIGIVFGTTIKTKNGKIVEGDIEGLVFIKFLTDQEEQTHYVMDPEGITAIDEQGIHLDGHSWVRALDCYGNEPRSKESRSKDEDVIKYVESHFELTERGGVSFPLGCVGPCCADQHSIYRHMLTDVRILGQFVAKDEKIRFLPSLNVTTEKGLIVLPIAEIIEFTKK